MRLGVQAQMRSRMSRRIQTSQSHRLAHVHPVSYTHLRAAADASDAALGRAASALRAFLQLIEGMSRAIASLPLHEQVDHVINASGLLSHHQKEKADRGEARVENLLELVSAARGFDPEGDVPPLQSFLAHAVLESGEGQGTQAEDCVQMMTLHTAKGLEFPPVSYTHLDVYKRQVPTCA